MKRPFLLTIALAAALSATTTLHIRAANRVAPSGPSIVEQATNGAFRDGLYVGRMDASTGRDAHVSSGRWSRENDRASFAAGYRAGYQNSGAGLGLQ